MGENIVEGPDANVLQNVLLDDKLRAYTECE